MPGLSVTLIHTSHNLNKVSGAIVNTVHQYSVQVISDIKLMWYIYVVESTNVIYIYHEAQENSCIYYGMVQTGCNELQCIYTLQILVFGLANSTELYSYE